MANMKITTRQHNIVSKADFSIVVRMEKWKFEVDKKGSELLLE